MGESTASRSHAILWWLGVIALPILYVLSVPAVLLFANVKVHPQDLHFFKKQPQWSKTFCIPYNWALNNTPLQEPLNQYAALWGYKRIPNWAAMESMLRERENFRRKTEELLKRPVTGEEANKLRAESLQRSAEHHRRRAEELRTKRTRPMTLEEAKKLQEEMRQLSRSIPPP
jgi:hypothetical protein